MLRKEKNLGLANLTPMGKEVSGNVNKHYFDGKCMKCLDVHMKLHFCQPFTVHWTSGVVAVNFAFEIVSSWN